MNNQQIMVGSVAPDFQLYDQNAQPVRLYDLLKNGPALLVFYPGDFTMVCTKQLCNYRDNLSSFKQYGIQVVGVSTNAVDEHRRFAQQFDFQFPLLSDPGHVVAKRYGCTSLLMMGGISRSVFIVGKNAHVLYRYVEPTVLTRRKADELSQVMMDLRKKQMI